MSIFISRITTTYFMSNTSTTKNPINPKSQHNRNQEKNQSRSGSEVHLRKLITNLRFSRFKKSNEFGLSSYQGSRSGFFIRDENWSIRKRTSFQLSLTLGRGRYICYNLIYVDNLKTNYLLYIKDGNHTNYSTRTTFDQQLTNDDIQLKHTMR